MLLFSFISETKKESEKNIRNFGTVKFTAEEHAQLIFEKIEADCRCDGGDF